LARGEIVAIKGIGGFHLAVRADSEPCVARLRTLKRREHKPFAVMCADVLTATRLVEMSASARRLLCSPSTPVVLAPRRAFAPVAPSVARDSHRVGVMLPYTPIHHVLFRALGPYAPPLVMTSGNLSDDPLVIDDAEAIRVLGPVCDSILLHDRPIERPVDDSVFIDVADDEPLPVRRARGFVPLPIALPIDSGTQGLAVGGELKSTVAVVTGGTAVVGQHLGDVTRAASLEVFRRTVRDLCELFRVTPGWVARDMHPMYLSSTHGRALAVSWKVPLVDVQHHHAHAAAVMAEHGVEGPVVAVVCDGTGYGSDGTIWGGELLVADLVSFRRIGRLRPLRLAGGDAAAKDVRRCAMALMYGAMGEDFHRHAIVERMVPDSLERRTLCQMIQGNVACATSSGAGRYFDGIAAILGLSTRNHFEAEAAMALEAAAARWEGETPAVTGDLFEVRRDGELAEISLDPLVRAIVAGHGQGTPREALALLFHEQFAHAWATTATEAARSTGIETVALSGGVFCNEILTRRLTHLLRARGLRVLRHRVVPPNDGGLSLGQAAVAAARMRRRREAR
jgi:hydrogenase maturation protein HypF